MKKSTSIAHPVFVDAKRIVTSKTIGRTICVIGISRWTTSFIGNIKALRITITTAVIGYTMARCALKSSRTCMTA